ncbi:MAG: hypothetical protein ACRDZY_03395, partial [Acidimicrobiales bacterium]
MTTSPAPGEHTAPEGAAEHTALEDTVPEGAPEDLHVGAFSLDPPWLIRPEALAWRTGAAALRAETAAQVPVLLRRRRLPPGRRALEVGLRLGT